VGFAEIRNENNDLTPEVVRKHLEDFTSRGFLVSSIFCDLQNIDILGTFAAVATTNADVKPVYKTMFAALLAEWLVHVKANAASNPYILGYLPHYPSASDPDADVPDSLKPVGNTFNVFFDKATPPRSTLNFIINIKDSALPHGTHPPTDIFDTSWLSAGDIADGKMAFSYRSFAEEFYSAACNPTFFLKAVCSTFARATTKSGNTNSLRLSLKLFLV
jgi:hypothetical protein